MGLGIAGIVAAAAAAAGAVYLFGTKSGQKKGKQIKSWMIKMRADVMDEIKGMTDWSKEAYEKAVDTVMEKYKTLQEVNVEELVDVAGELKKHWNVIHKTIMGTSKKSSKK